MTAQVRGVTIDFHELASNRWTLTMDIQQAMKSPAAVFGTPEVLDESTELSAGQKRAILLQWKDQLQQLLVADDESMLRAGASSGANADCLRRVTDILTRLNAG